MNCENLDATTDAVAEVAESRRVSPDAPRHYVELYERVDAVAGGGIYRWLIYDSASEGESRFGWFCDEEEARKVMATLAERDS